MDQVRRILASACIAIWVFNLVVMALLTHIDPHGAALINPTLACLAPVIGFVTGFVIAPWVKDWTKVGWRVGENFAAGLALRMEDRRKKKRAEYDAYYDARLAQPEQDEEIAYYADSDSHISTHK